MIRAAGELPSIQLPAANRLYDILIQNCISDKVAILPPVKPGGVG